MKTSRLFGVASIVMSVLFWISVALQYNDPDPIQWMLIYGAAAIVSMLTPYRANMRRSALLVLFVSVPWMLYLLMQVLGVISFSDLFLKMNEKGGAVEVGRETGGLAIVSFWMLLCALRRDNNASPSA